MSRIILLKYRIKMWKGVFMRYEADSIGEYIAQLLVDRKAVIIKLRKIVEK